MSVDRAAFPAFARDFPADADLDALVLAFVRGDYGLIREKAPMLIAKTRDPVVRQAAEVVLERTKPDPLASVFYLLTAALVVFLSTYWWWRARGAR